MSIFTSKLIPKHAVVEGHMPISLDPANGAIRPIQDYQILCHGDPVFAQILCNGDPVFGNLQSIKIDSSEY